MKPVTVGAVLYDPKVSIIWDIIREFFGANVCPMDVQRRSGGTCRCHRHA